MKVVGFCSRGEVMHWIVKRCYVLQFVVLYKVASIWGLHNSSKPILTLRLHLPSKKSLCCVSYSTPYMSNDTDTQSREKLVLVVRVCFIPGALLSFIDWLIDFEPLIASQANLNCKWISGFWADTPTATNSITTILHTHKLSASQLKKLTDRPCSTLPDQICNLSAGKHAGGLKVEEPSIWSRYTNHCSVCSTWAHFTLQRTGESIWAPR